jgi:hypothetical protein
LAPLSDAERRDLLEVIEDRTERRSTLVASQLPPTACQAAIGEPNEADAICDRLIHRAHKLTLKGPTMRDPETRRSKGKSRSPQSRHLPDPRQPVDRARPVEYAQNAFPTRSLDAQNPSTRSTGVLLLRLYEDTKAKPL